MDHRKLQAFASVYELKSFSKAGKDLYLSQPTISTHVLSLEEELGVKLFDRIGRRTIPTQAGHLLHEGVSKVFRIMEQTMADLHDLKNNVCGQVVIGGSTIPANYLLPMVISDFCRQHPQVCVDLRIGDSIQICQEVLAGNLDFGIVGGFVDHFDLEHTLVLKDKLHVLVSPELKLDLPSPVIPENLKDLPWVHREKGSGTRNAFENAMMKCGVSLRDLRVSALVQSTEALVKCLLAGAGVGVTSFLAVQKHLDSGELEIIDVSGFDISRSFFIIQHRGRSLFSCSRMMMDRVKEYIRTLNTGEFGARS